MLKTNFGGALLALVLGLLSLGTAWLFFSYLQSAPALQLLQAQVLRLNQHQAALQGVLTEAVEYSKRDPSMETFLQSMGFKVRTNAPQASAKPAAQ